MPTSSQQPDLPRLKTDFERELPPINLIESPHPAPPDCFIGTTLTPTHLKLNQFGSRFLPHTTAQMRCLLPLPEGRLLLIGHDDGLSVLDTYPLEWNDQGGITTKGPDEAKVLPVWTGEV